MSATAITSRDLLRAATVTRTISVRVILERSIVAGLLAVIALVAVPYGTVEPWWISAFNCSIFALAAVWLAHTMVQGDWGFTNKSLLLPIVVATGFVFLQSVVFSVDPHETRILFFRVLAFTVLFVLLSRYTSTNKRLNLLVHTVAAVALMSALFGIIRYTQQQNEAGFWLPFLRRGSGFGQFVNKNHFALLMEMATGLLGGFVLGGGVKRNRILFYVAPLALMWTALVLTSSRGGLLSMFAQVVFLVVILVWTRFKGTQSTHSVPGEATFSVPGAPATGRPRRVLKLATASALAILLLLVIGVSSIWVGGDLLVTRLESLSGEIRADATDPNAGVRRREVWAATWELFKSQPVAGTGFGAYAVAITRFHNASGKWTPEAAHNDYLELFASGGVIGVALLIWFAIAFCRSSGRQLKHSDPTRRAICLGALTGIFGVVAHSAVDFGLHVTVNTVVLIVLIVLATQEIKEQTG